MLEQPSFQDFLDAWPIFSDAIWTSMLAGMALGILGVYIVLGRMVFLTAALSQVASLGVAVTYLLSSFIGGLTLSLSPTFGSLIFVLICLVFALRFDEDHRRDRDAILGILFVGGSSGTLIIAGIIPQEMADIQTLLFGSAVAVLPKDLILVSTSVALILGLQVLVWRGFVEMIFDPMTAKVRGLPLPLLRWLLVGSLAVMVATITRILGALPTFSFTVLPAIVAIRWSPNIARAMLIAGQIGIFMGVVGYYIAFIYGFPVGASQTLVGLMLVLFSLTFSTLQRLIPTVSRSPSLVSPSEPRPHDHNPRVGESSPTLKQHDTVE